LSRPVATDEPGFRWLWAAHTVSVFGSLITRTALPFTAILSLDASAIDMALLSVTDLVASVATSFVVAPWVDRLRRRPLMLAADLGRAAALVTVPVAAATGLLRLELLYAVALVTGSLDTLFELSQAAYVPELVPRDRLLTANATLSASASAAEIAAFGVGGWLVQWLGAPRAIAVDAATFVASACCLACIAYREPPAADHTATVRWREATRGVDALIGDRVLRRTVLADAAGAFGLRAFGAVFLLFVTRDLGFAPGILGLLFATGGLSSLAGATLAPSVGRRLGAPRAVTAGIALMGGALLLIPLAGGATTAGVVLLAAQQLVGDGAYTIASVHEVSLRQARVPAGLLGRANAAKRLLDTAAMGAGALAAGVLGQVGDLRWALALAGAVPLLAGVTLGRNARRLADG